MTVTEFILVIPDLGLWRWWLSEAQWLASLASLMKPRPVKSPVSKSSWDSSWRMTLGVDLRSPHSLEQVHTHGSLHTHTCKCIHAYMLTYTQRHESFMPWVSLHTTDSFREERKKPRRTGNGVGRRSATCKKVPTQSPVL